MTLKSLKPAQALQSRIGSAFSSVPMSANQVTFLSLLFAAFGFLFSLSHQPYFSLFFFLLAFACDALDGAIARAKKQSSALGAYIDGITDRLVEFLLVLSFFQYALPAFILPSAFLLLCVLFFGTCMTSFATAYAEHRHVADEKKIRAQPGILPRAERVIGLSLAMFLIPLNPDFASAVLFAEAALCIITFAQRFWHFAR